MPGPIVCLHHLSTPILGFAADALRAGGVELVECDVARGEPLPALGEVGGLRRWAESRPRWTSPASRS